MKTDRLYALTLYLLNHGKSSASELAKHFEVSVRTIQRDIDALCQAGIPICALTGTNGGYEILSDFQMNNQLASKDEYAYIATAINGLKTVTNNPVADDIYEKITAISKNSNTGMILDFSVLREGDKKMGIDVYEQIPVMESEKFLLREIEDGDAEDLLKVYSDKDAVPLFSSDNCVNGFYYTSIEEMKHTIVFWKREYQSRYYVREV